MVLLFLRDWRSAAIVVVTIPFALLAAVVALWGAGPDDQHHDARRPGARGRHPRRRSDGRDREHPHASRRAARPVGARRARRQRRSRRAAAAGDAVGRRGVRAVVLHDRRLAVAVRAALARGRLRDDRVVPAVELARAGAVGLAAGRHRPADRSRRGRGRLGASGCASAWAGRCGGSRRRAGCWSPSYAVVTVGDRASLVGLDARARDLSGAAAPASFSCASARRPARSSNRPSGWRRRARRDQDARPGRATCDITLGYVGVQPSSYPINTIFLWTGGSHEGVLQVALRPDAGASRSRTSKKSCAGASASGFPTAQFSFEPGDIVSRIMNFGAPTPVEVAVTGPDFAASRTFATTVRDELARIPDAARSAVRAGARLSGDPGRRQPPAGRSARRDRRSDRPVVCRGDLVEPVRGAELLGRSADRHRVPGAGRDAAAADDAASTICASFR